jgi:hypothetical protein
LISYLILALFPDILNISFMIKRIIFSFLLLLLVGLGCLSTQSVSDEAVQSTTAALLLQPNSMITLKQTVFGLGGVFAETVSGDDLAEYQMTIVSFNPGVSAVFSWTNTAKQETAASAAARQAYEATDHPIGDTAKEPDPVYETIIKAGTYTTSGLAEATSVLLPAYWVEGEQNITDNSLVWLSKKQYQDLINTKTTTLSLGLFDEKISSLLGITDTVQNALNLLQQKAAEAAKSQDVYKLTAANDWQTYSLIINGEEKTVRTISASNWFGSYVILANENNPIILKATLNPFAVGSLDLASPLSSFLGYEITMVVTN